MFNFKRIFNSWFCHFQRSCWHVYVVQCLSPEFWKHDYNILYDSLSFHEKSIHHFWVIWNQLFFSFKSSLYFGVKIQIWFCVIPNNFLFCKCAIEFVLTVTVLSFLKSFPVLFSLTEKWFNFMKASKASLVSFMTNYKTFLL